MLQKLLPVWALISGMCVIGIISMTHVPESVPKTHTQGQPGAEGATPNEISAPSCGPKKVRLYPGIAPGWVYYFRTTIAAFAITGTNPYS